jgi:hypothetical protein
MAAPEKWTFDSVSGLALLLVDSRSEHKFEWLHFNRNGTVDSESGYDGPDHRERLKWKINSAGNLFIYSDTEIYDELILVSHASDIITVKRRGGGGIAKFKVLHYEQGTRRYSFGRLYVRPNQALQLTADRREAQFYFMNQFPMLFSLDAVSG